MRVKVGSDQFAVTSIPASNAMIQLPGLSGRGYSGGKGSSALAKLFYS